MNLIFVCKEVLQVVFIAQNVAKAGKEASIDVDTKQLAKQNWKIMLTKRCCKHWTTP